MPASWYWHLRGHNESASGTGETQANITATYWESLLGEGGSRIRLLWGGARGKQGAAGPSCPLSFLSLQHTLWAESLVHTPGKAPDHKEK